MAEVSDLVELQPTSDGIGYVAHRELLQPIEHKLGVRHPRIQQTRRTRVAPQHIPRSVRDMPAIGEDRPSRCVRVLHADDDVAVARQLLELERVLDTRLTVAVREEEDR